MVGTPSYKMHLRHRRVSPWAFVGTAALTLVAGVALAALPDAEHLVTQKGKRFGPHDLALHPGENVTVVNDDGDLVHHAYIDTPDLAYDSGDIEPGARVVIPFPKEGDFTVLCGVHPKMRLAVHVR